MKRKGAHFWTKKDDEQRRTVLYEGDCFVLWNAARLLSAQVKISCYSGAGKTVLLDTLTGIDRADVNVTGVVTINGEELRSADMRRVSAYVQQADLFIGTLTVKEQLQFSVNAFFQ
uniref:ABC transporter domain-containing protein n=1 Tax=Parascaris equorum TaxID=6256 RepID=A0A914RJ05_PAREQ